MASVVPPENEVAFEKWVIQQISGPIRGDVEKALRAIVALYLRLAGGLGEPLPDASRRLFATEAAKIIASIKFAGRRPLQTFVESALALGAARGVAAGLSPVNWDTASRLISELPDWIEQLVATIGQRVLAILASAESAWLIGAPPANFNEAMSRMALAYRAITTVERDAGWAVNAAISAAYREAIDAAQMERVWIAEDDARLHCLAHSGRTALYGRPYPIGITFYINPAGEYKRPNGYRPVWGPPLHPHCRCREEPYLGSEGYPVMKWEGREVSFAEALQREARRRVLLGKSGSDSLRARLRAADVLLQVGARLPKSVEARARAAVRAGHF